MVIRKTQIKRTGEVHESIITSVEVSKELYELCKQHNIKFVDAIRTGISILLAEKGEIGYDNKLNLYRKMNYFRSEAEKALQKISELMKETTSPPIK